MQYVESVHEFVNCNNFFYFQLYYTYSIRRNVFYFFTFLHFFKFLFFLERFHICVLNRGCLRGAWLHLMDWPGLDNCGDDVMRQVHDYIKSYLGESKQVQTFAQQFLEKRSKLRNAAKPKHEVFNWDDVTILSALLRVWGTALSWRFYFYHE